MAKPKTLNEKLAALTESEPEQQEQKLNKSALIREAVDAGYDKPAVGVDWIKSKYGVEIDPQVYSQTKSKYLKDKEAGTVVGSGNQGRPFAQMTPAYTTPKAFSGPALNADNSMELAEQIKGLIRTFGAENVLRAVRLFTE